MKKLAKPLEEFVSSKADFRVVYLTKTLATLTTRRIFVLDSSFNPPHLGHYALVKEALRYHKTLKSAVGPGTVLFLLLLSVKNADKPVQPAPFDKRLDMMYLMAKYMEQDLDIDVSIGLTNHAKFVDKAVSISQYLKNLFPDEYMSMRLTFLVGFDTLIRIFDPKYYVPDKLLEVLDTFMKTTDLFCLTRTDTLRTYQQQDDYVTLIRHGHHAHIPQAWAESVHLYSVEDENKDLIGKISSSAIRNHDAPENLIPLIAEYVEKEKLYKGESS